MSKLRLEILTIEGKEFDEEVNMVIAPGSEGMLGILPKHIPVLTALTFGELQVKTDGQPDQFFAIGGGYMEVQPHHVIVMADSAERATEIDLERAEVARQRAEQLLSETKASTEVDAARAEAALRRSIARIKVANKRRRNNRTQRNRSE